MYLLYFKRLTIINILIRIKTDSFSFFFTHTHREHTPGAVGSHLYCILMLVIMVVLGKPNIFWGGTALEVAEGQLVSAQTIRHKLQQDGLHGCRPWKKPSLKLVYKKACKQFAEDNLAKSMNYWNHVLWSDESKVNLFDSDGVQHVWRCPGKEYTKTVPCLQSSMVVVASWSGAAWLLLVLGSCGSLRETWIPTCTVTFWSRT